MVKLLLKKIVDNNFFVMLRSLFTSFSELIKEKLKSLSDKQKYHMQNIAVLWISYTLVSIFVYPEFKLSTYLKELFSLMCAYGAIFLWFINKIANNASFRISVGVTACVAPMLFINNSFIVAALCILLIILCEFIVVKYMNGCRLFAGTLPVYVICDDEKSAMILEKHCNKFKILELIVLHSSSHFSRLRSIEDLRTWLDRIKNIPFIPVPRRLMYFSQQTDEVNIKRLLEISAEFSIPLVKISNDTLEPLSNTFAVSPISFEDYESVVVTSQDKTSLAATFKGKKVWICYDGSSSVLDLIYATSLANVSLTVMCETELLAHEIERELIIKRKCKNCPIKIINISLLDCVESKPDVLFYSLPLKSCNVGENNLRESVIANVINTHRLIQNVQSLRIPYTIILSSVNAFNATSWVGATLRLGELFAQFADTQSKKTHSKFRVIRIPNSADDRNGYFGRIVSSIFSDGRVHLDVSTSESVRVCHRKDILPLLLRAAVLAVKSYNSTSCVYTIDVSNGMNLDDLIQYVCCVLCLKKETDINVVYSAPNETMDLEIFPNIAEETLEKTAVDNIWSTNFKNINLDSYDHMWTPQEISQMSTRELISAVYQSLNEKITEK